MNIDIFNQKMKRDGWIVFPPSVSADLIGRLNQDLAKAYTVCRAIQIKNGIADGTDGTTHHLIGQGDSFLELLEQIPLWHFIKEYFEGNNFILNTYGGIIKLAQSQMYIDKVHRDIRTFSGSTPLMLNMLVMLDDFTLRNGATYLGTGTHLRPGRPSDQEFFKHAERAIGKSGSILLFNSNLWHAAGTNNTEKERRALSMVFTRPYMKQQCDYPRILGYDYVDKLSESMKQIIGYNSRVPATLEEWYQPPEKRMYKPGQG